MILFDGVHLVSDSSLPELHAFAALLGLRRRYFQDHRHPHYDVLSETYRRKAFVRGAQHVSTRNIVKWGLRV